MGSTPMADDAVHDERLRIARELHDTIGQALYGIALGARSAAGYLETDPRRAGEALAYIQSAAEQARIELRTILFDLRPDSLVVDGLRAALIGLARMLEARYGLAVEVVADEEPEVPTAIKSQLYAIAREATTNVVKHARARHVTITLRQGAELVLSIADDGIGFDPSLHSPVHYGLTGMRERAAAFRGRLDVTSDPESGTTISAIIPSPAEFKAE